MKRSSRFAMRCGGMFLSALLLAPLLLVLPFRWVNPPTSAFILANRANARHVERSWVPLRYISPELQVAVIASEDQKFPVHSGFDVAEITKAIDERLTGERNRGASTISQQVAKNLYLWPGPSFVRKAIEAYMTSWLEWCWPKRRILEVYLNIAEFGPGIFGAGAASNDFFDKPARALSAREAALLAAVLPNPRRMSAQRPSTYVKGRATEIEDRVRKLGGVTYLHRL